MDYERTRLHWPMLWETSPRRLFSKILSGPLILLVTVLLCSTTAYAAEVHEERAPPGRVAIDGIQILNDVQDAQDVLEGDAKPGDQCMHHPEHTGECGYVPAVEAVPCGHQHDEVCQYVEAVEGTPCTHVHNESCEYAQAVPEVPCDKGCIPDETGILVHTPDCAYTPAAAELPCVHTHDDACGYKEPVAGIPCVHTHNDDCGFVEGKEEVPCGFVCEICPKEPPLEPDPEPGEEEEPQPPEEQPPPTEPIPPREVLSWAWDDDESFLSYVEETGIWGLSIPGTNEEQQLTAELLKPFLPATITATLADNVQEAIALTWDLSGIQEEGVCEGSFTLSAALPEAYILSQTAPKLEVLVDFGEGGILAITNKYVNWWQFVSRDDTPLPRNDDNYTGKLEIIAAIPDLSSKNIEGIVKCLQDEILPTRIKCWGTWGPYGIDYQTDLAKAGFTCENPESSDEKFAYDNGSFVKYLSDTYKWGFVNIKWKNFPKSLDALVENKFDLVAYIEPQNGYQIVVNSNKIQDHKDGRGSTLVGQNPDLMKLTVTLADLNPSDHIVQSVEPDNVTVNLFDYWVEEYGEDPKPRDLSKPVSVDNPDGDILQKSDWHYHEGSSVKSAYSKMDDWYKGINIGRLLMFGDGVIHAGLWNKGAGQNSNYGNKYAGMEGIVRRVLEKGFPVVNTDMADKIMMGVSESDKENYRDHTLIKDYLLAGIHMDKDVYDQSGHPIEEDKVQGIQNLSDELMKKWKETVNDASLAYLFDPAEENNHKNTYINIKGLFQLDEEGYYYYNMRENFAEFQEDKVSDEEGNVISDGQFILYDAPATTRTDTTDQEPSIGNFFPFNTGEEVFTGISKEGKLTSNVKCFGNSMNHHLGMTVEVDFRQPVNGQITNDGNHPMKFEFAGDDDVWVFIDDVLVLDLGGVHSEIYGSIDFSNGNVYIGRAFGTKGIPEDPADETNLVTKTTLKALYEAAGIDVENDTMFWRPNSYTYSDNSTHTLKMFYLERGNYDSSIALQFNLQPPLYQQVKKVDQNGAPIEGVEFKLYKAKKNGGEYTATGDHIAELKTGKDGIARFLNPDTTGDTPFNFSLQDTEFFILKEVNTPNGYRPIPVDIVLQYHPAKAMLTVVNRWTTGAYSSFTSFVNGNNDVSYGKLTDEGEIKPSDHEIVPPETQKNGLVVAIPMVEVEMVDESGTSHKKVWKALYGSNMSEFHAIQPEERKIEFWRKAALEALLYQCATVEDSHWYLDWNDKTNRLDGTLLDFPGQASRYKLLNPESADMRMEYAIIDPKVFETLLKDYTHGNSKERYEALRQYVLSLKGSDGNLETAIETAIDKISKVQGSGNTGIRFLNIDKFMRNFRSLIYIPNEQRELRVWKVDQNGKGINGVEFGLYRDESCTEETKVTTGKTGTVEGRDGVLVLAPYVNGGDGYATVLWANAATEERYYLKELAAPEGYDLNETVIPVVVGIYSIYADAGEANDGVTVMGGVGKLAQTMVQFASNEDINITLRDITAFAQRKSSHSFEMNGWGDETLAGTDNILRDMDLHYGMNSLTPRDYGLHEEDGGTMFYPFFAADTGFIRARVKQNYPALIDDIFDSANNNRASKENLRDIDISTLFSLLNVVVVTDQNNVDTQNGQLIISKKVAGDVTPEERTKLYKFQVTLTDSEGKPLKDEYHYYFYGEDKTGRLKSGDALLLHHDESVTILGLPVGTKCKVEELNSHDLWPIDPGPIIEGVIKKDESVNAAFINNQSPSTETGLLTVSKTVSGDQKPGDDSLRFEFTLNLRDESGKPLEGTYSYHVNDVEGIDKIGDNEKIFLHHNERITIYGLPVGTKFTVTEAAVDGWMIQGPFSGEIGKGSTAEVSFVNKRTESPPVTPDPPSEPDDPGGNDPGTKPPDKPTVTPPPVDPPEQPEQPENPEEPPVTPVDPSDPGTPGTPDGPSQPDPDEPVFIVGDPEVPFFGWNLPDDPVPTFGPPPEKPGDPPKPRSGVPLTGERERADLALILGSLLGLGVLYVESHKKKHA